MAYCTNTIGSLFHLYTEGNSEPCHILLAFSWYLFFLIFFQHFWIFLGANLFIFYLQGRIFFVPPFLIFCLFFTMLLVLCFLIYYFTLWISWYLHFTYNSVSLQNFLDTLLFFFICNIWCSILLTFFLFVLFYRFFLIIISPFHFLFWIFIFSFWKIKISLPVCWQPPLFSMNILWHSWDWQCCKLS